MTEYLIGDPVVDLAQGRAMIVLDAPDLTVREWSDVNDYDLTENYANAKLGATETEGVVECAYVSDIRSEPSKSYTFPASRVCLIDAHHADDGRRVYDRVAVDVLRRLIAATERIDIENADGPGDTVWLLAGQVIGADIASEARELADVQERFGGEDDRA